MAWLAETSPEEIYHGAGSSGRDTSSYKRLHHSPRYQRKVSSFLHKSLFVYILATMDTSQGHERSCRSICNWDRNGIERSVYLDTNYEACRFEV